MRNLENDENYNVKRAVLEAPQLILQCGISTQEDRIGSKKKITAVLSVQISDLKTCEVVELRSISWGTIKSRW